MIWIVDRQYESFHQNKVDLHDDALMERWNQIYLLLECRWDFDEMIFLLWYGCLIRCIPLRWLFGFRFHSLVVWRGVLIDLKLLSLVLVILSTSPSCSWSSAILTNSATFLPKMSWVRFANIWELGHRMASFWASGNEVRTKFVSNFSLKMISKLSSPSSKKS